MMIGSFVGSRLLVDICRHLNLSCCEIQTVGKIRTVVVMGKTRKFGSICSVRSPKTFCKHSYCTSVDSKKSGHVMPKNVFSRVPVNGIATTDSEDFRNDKRETGRSADQSETGRSPDQSETRRSADQSENQQSADTVKQSSTEILQNLPEDDKLRLKAIQLEYYSMLEMGQKVPSDVTDNMWLELLSQKTKSGRNRKMHFFFTRECHHSKRKEAKRNSPDLKKIYRDTDTMQRKISQTTMATYYKGRMAQAMQFGHPLIVDIGYGEFLRDDESSDTAEQLKYGYFTNKVSRDSFNLIFCNIRQGQRELSRMLQHLSSTKEDFMATMTEKSYVDLYTRNDLVYLTPYSNNILTEFNPHKVYIIGGYVDRSASKRLPLAKAKRDGIRHAKLPLDNYLKRSGNQFFTIDQMIKVLLEVKEHGNWSTAFKKSFPKRKVAEYYTEYTEVERRENKLLNGRHFM